MIIGQGALPEDRLKAALVVGGQVDIVGAKLRVHTVNAPVEHDGRAGVELVLELFRFTVFGEQLLVDIRKVCIPDEDITYEYASILQLYTF